MQLPKIVRSVFFDRGAQRRSDFRRVEPGQRQMRSEGAFFGREAERCELLIDVMSQWRQIFRRLYAAPNDARAIRIWKKSDITEMETNLLCRANFRQ